MADEKQLAILRQGPEAWNVWRHEHPDIKAKLSGAYLSGANLSGANLSDADLSVASFYCTDLSGADLSGAYLIKADLTGACLIDANLTNADLGEACLIDGNLSGASLYRADLRNADLARANFTRAYFGEANLSESNLGGANLTSANLIEANLSNDNLTNSNLSGANLTRADLSGANLTRANLSGANLTRANLTRAYLGEADLSGANLTRANLRSAVLVRTCLESANLTGCCVYGISAWDLILKEATQKDLIITSSNYPTITVDNLEVAQFIYLLLNNERIRHVIDTITSKMVLILGRFMGERKAILDALRDEVRKLDYLPVLFDFEKPAGKDLTGTIQTLANMARFIIADLTDPSSVPHELAIVVPGTVVPVQPVVMEGQHEYSMFVDLKRRHHWVLEPYRYNSLERLLADLGERIIGPAETKARELRLTAASQGAGR